MSAEPAKKRKNGMQTVRDLAVQAAREGRGVAACPYHNTPHRTVWLVAFASEAQLELRLAG